MTLAGSEIIPPHPFPSGKDTTAQKKISSPSNDGLSKKLSGSSKQFVETVVSVELNIPHSVLGTGYVVPACQAY